LFLEPLEDRTLPSAGWAIAPGGTGTFGGDPHVSQPDPTTGDLYVTGYFYNGTVTFSLLNGGTTTLTAAATDTTSYVAKVDPSSGKFLWAEQFGGKAGSPGAGSGIAVDASGNIDLTGEFSGTQQFGGFSLTDTSTFPEGYICKMDPNGNILWANEFAYGTGGSHSGTVTPIAVDANGDPYLIWFANSNGSAGAFLSKYDTNGNLQWTQQLANNGSVWDVTVDSSGNAYVAGNGFISEYSTSGTMIWTQLISGQCYTDAIYQDPTTGKNLLYTFTSQGLQQRDAATGSVIWSKPNASGVIAVDTSGYVYLNNLTEQDYNADPGPGVATLSGPATTVTKLDSAGNFLTAWDFGCVHQGSNIIAPSIVDASGDIYTVGVFSGPMNFDTGSQIVSLPNSGKPDMFLVKTTQGTGTIFGRVINSVDNAGIPGVTVYLDLNNSGSYVAGDPTATTDSQGYYQLKDVAPSSSPYTLRQIVPSGYTIPTGQPTSLNVSVSAGLASETTGFSDVTPDKVRTYSNTTAVSTNKHKPNAISSLTVPDSYTVLGITLALTVSNPNNNALSIYLTGPNGTKISVGSSNQNGTLTFQVPNFDYTSVTGPWTLEVDGLAGGTLKSWSLNIDGTLS
jgi:hypothetical protein